MQVTNNLVRKKMKQNVLDALAEAARKDSSILKHLSIIRTESGIHPLDPVKGRNPVHESLDYIVDALQRDGLDDDGLHPEISFHDNQYIKGLTELGFQFPVKRPNLNRRHLAPTHAWGSDMILSKLSFGFCILTFFATLLYNISGLLFADRMEQIIALANILFSIAVLLLIFALAVWYDSSQFLYQISQLKLPTILGIMIRSRRGIALIICLPVGVAIAIGISQYVSWFKDIHSTGIIILLSLFIFVWHSRPPVCLLLGASGEGKSEDLIKSVMLAFIPFRFVHLLFAPNTATGSHSIRTWNNEWRQQVDSAAQTAAFLIIDTRHDTPHVREEVMRWGSLSNENKVVLYVVPDNGNSPVLSALGENVNRDDLVRESELEEIIRRLRMTRNIIDAPITFSGAYVDALLRPNQERKDRD
jgi:hypothetical protein